MASPGGPKIAYLWGNLQEDQANGTFVKLPAGFEGKIESKGSLFRAVVIKGVATYRMSESEVKLLSPGSYFSSKGASMHEVSSMAEEESLFYIHTNGSYDIVPN